MGMIDTIKKASMGAVGASNPVNILFGEVLDVNFIIKEEIKGKLHYFQTTKIDILTIKVDQKLILDKEFFIVPKDVAKYEVQLEHSHTCPDGATTNKLDKLIIREGLKKKDKVLLLRVQGGQQYIILGKVIVNYEC